MVTEIAREDLLVWADTPPAAPDLPRLVRRLILETTTEVTGIDFPGGGGVASGGFDGVAEASSSTAFVPAGTSVWELSVQDGANRKAEEDYGKRMAGPGGTATRDCTYVQVIARPWTDHEEWAAEKAKDGRWRAVRGYNVDTLEMWLEQAPTTTAWLARRLGLPTDGVVAVRDWFDAWAEATEPATTREFVLAGRSRVAEEIQALLNGPPRVVTVGGEARAEELQAVVVAALTATDTHQGAEARAVIVEDQASFRRLLDHRTPTAIVISEPSWLTGPTGHHHVVVAVASSDAADVIVPPVAGEQISETLRLDGLDRREADELGELARRSLMAFRRRRARQPAIHRPAWAGPGVDRVRRRLLLADRWQERKEGDLDAVAGLVGDSYGSVEDQLSTISRAEDPMVAVVDGVWHVVSPKDTWELLGRQLSRRDLESFEAVALEVLTERDPSLELPSDERWLASVRGLRRRYSVTLREGLAHTLAKLGAYDATVDTGAGMTGQRWADRIVKELLDRANADLTLSTWASLAPLLPLVAEAAPSTFLRAVGEGVGGDDPLLGGMFQDQQSDALGSFASSPHTGLLWALERVAWSPEHFDTAVSVLAMLAELDRGGRLSNRPQASLESIFCPWLPHTSAPEDQRLATLERLRQRFPEVAWPLLLSQLPESHSIQMDTDGGSYRDWGRIRPPVTRAGYLRVVETIAETLINWIRERPDRCVELIDRADHLPPAQRRSLAATLTDIVGPDGLVTDHERADVWEALRSLIAKHREYADAKWALPEPELEPLADALDALEPTDPAARDAWLFSDGLVTLGDRRRRDDHDAYEATLAERRRAAVEDLLALGGLDAVTAFAKDVAAPHYVGVALADTGDGEHDEAMVLALDSASDALRSAAHGYVTRRFRAGGWGWLDTLVSSVEEASPVVIARTLLASRDPEGGPVRADELGGAVAERYWREFQYQGLGHLPPEVVDELARRLLASGRPAATLDLLALYEHRRSESDGEHAALVADAFEDLLGTDDPEIHRLSSYEIERLFAVLAEHRDTVGRDRVLGIEWAFAPALGYEPDLQNTYATMTTDPDIFVQLVGLRDRHVVDGESPSDDERRMGENAFWVLSGWKTCPGTTADGPIDVNVLRSWVERARAAFAEHGLQDVGDLRIGEALAHAPPDEDGTWPPVPVRDLMEELASDDLDRGFEIQVFNNRGVHFRDPQGGDDERRLTATYRGHAEEARVAAPRVATILDRLAKTYETEARQHDDEAERRRRGLGW